MLMQTKSISDSSLLLAVGFYGINGPDVVRISNFCGVTERTARRWLKDGLSSQARTHFENLLNGDYLPAEWRRHGIKVAADCIYTGGYKVPLDVVRYWPFLCKAIDWNKAVIPRPG